MTQLVVPLGKKPYSSPYNSIGREICQNLYMEISPSENAKSSYYFLKIPGLSLLKPNTTNIGGCRGIFTTAAKNTYVVNGSSFCQLLEDGTVTILGTLRPGTSQVSFAENGYQLILVDGEAGYIFDFKTNNFTIITDEYFPGNVENTKAPTKVLYIDTYFIVNIPNTNQYMWSNSYYKNDNGNDYDPTVVNGYWTPLQTGTKMGKSDLIYSMIDCTNMLWLFGTQSIEVHYDTGDYTNQLFARYEGAIIEIGCSAPNSVARYANNVFWLGSDKNGTVGVFTNEGMTPKRISTRGIEQIIEFMPVVNDCIGFVYSQAGHTFYVMQFLTVNKTLVYDLSTDSWHERTHLNDDGSITAWSGLNGSYNWSKNIIGHRSYSSYYELDTEYYLNDNPDGNGVNYIKCIKTTPVEFNNGLLLRFNSVQVMFRQGTGLNDNTSENIGLDPEVQIAFSDDAGESYSNERTAKIGKMGTYTNRSRLVSCGISRNRVWRITITDPVQVILVGLIADVTQLSR